LPGREKYSIDAKVIGDCCKNCPQCIDGSGGFYYGRLLWSGMTVWRTYSTPLGNNKYVADIKLIVDIGQLCEADLDCR
jgi:hypothetical protein